MRLAVRCAIGLVVVMVMATSVPAHSGAFARVGFRGAVRLVVVAPRALVPQPITITPTPRGHPLLIVTRPVVPLVPRPGVVTPGLPASA